MDIFFYNPEIKWFVQHDLSLEILNTIQKIDFNDLIVMDQENTIPFQKERYQNVFLPMDNSTYNQIPKNSLMRKLQNRDLEGQLDLVNTLMHRTPNILSIDYILYKYEEEKPFIIVYLRKNE